MGKLYMNQPDKKRFPVSPDEWLTHARSDLKLAKIGMEEDGVLNEQICFHAQQVVEKTCKAVLLFSKVDFPLTHDLQELIDILENAGIELPSEFMDIGKLTPYAVETRYPGYLEDITDNDVDEAVKLAEKVLKWAAEIISNY